MILRTEIMKFFNDYDYCLSDDAVHIEEITNSIAIDNMTDNNNNINDNGAANNNDSSNNDDNHNNITIIDDNEQTIGGQYYSTLVSSDDKNNYLNTNKTSSVIDADITFAENLVENNNYYRKSEIDFINKRSSKTNSDSSSSDSSSSSNADDYRIEKTRDDRRMADETKLVANEVVENINNKTVECWSSTDRTVSDAVKECSCIINEIEDCACSLIDDSGLESAASSWGKSVAEVNEHAFAKLEEELQNALETLKLRDEEVAKLSRIRQEVESELQELTASLFQEAHSMVREANLRQAAAEKALKESHMKVEVLTAEVSALKTLVLTSTPSKPNLHLHNNQSTRCKQESPSTAAGLFKKQHHRSPSHFDLKYGRESPPSSASSNVEEEIFTLPQSVPLEVTDGYEVDPNVNNEFMSWKENIVLDRSNPFISRIYSEDIDLCLSFNNVSLQNEVKNAIDNESIYIESVDKAKSQFPRKCALMEVPRLCHYRMKLGNSETYYISQICRNRIIAVCNFLNYLRYIQRGLVKSSVHDMYWEIIKHRKEMTLARLGLPVSSESC